MAGINYIPLILLGVGLNTLAQVALKAGMQTIGYFEFSFGNLIPISFQIMKNPYIIGGLVLYVISVGTWLLVLSRLDVSYAYPLTSVGYLVTALVGYYFLNENMSFLRILGILTIIGGVYLVARS